MKVLFVDDRPDEIFRLWQRSGCESEHELLPVEVFNSLERAVELVRTLQPDVVLVGYGLGKDHITGADVIRTLRQQGYGGWVAANSGGGVEQFRKAHVKVDGSTNRNPGDLREVLRRIAEREKHERPK